MNATLICPCCGKEVEAKHFSCHSGAIAGSTTGESKSRGGKAFYQALALRAAKKRKRNNALRRKQGLPVR